MKAILVSPDRIFQPSQLESAVQSDVTDGISSLSLNTFLFDLKTSSHLLANLQSFLGGLGYPYHLIYLPDEFDHFQYLGRK